MGWADVFHMLWLADWSAEQIAEAYGVDEERVRVLVGTIIGRNFNEPLYG
jgi:DNA-directed RNA polymerase specialized sigma24 family protein